MGEIVYLLLLKISYFHQNKSVLQLSMSFLICEKYYFSFEKGEDKEREEVEPTSYNLFCFQPMFEIALGITRAVDPGLAPNQLIGI